MKEERAKTERNHYYLVITNTGYFAIYDGQQCQQTIVGRDEIAARAILKEWQNPVKEKLPYVKSEVDALIEKVDGNEPKEPKVSSPKVENAKRAYRSAKDQITDPEIAAVLVGVTCVNGKYYPETTRAKLTELTSGKITTRLLKEAWSAGIIQGEQPRPKRKKKPVPA